jgi:hypothetical protein
MAELLLTVVFTAMMHDFFNSEKFQLVHKKAKQPALPFVTADA